MTKKFAYLMRTNNDVLLTLEKPKSLSISKNKKLWFFRKFEFHVNQSDQHRLIYSSVRWNGPIGVYYLPKSAVAQMMTMIGQLKAHLNSIKCGRVEYEVGKIVPLQIDNKQPPDGSGGFSYTRVGQAIRDGFNAPDCWHM